ncbi:tRNA 5-methylaminomethyl-2-thiouridine biosynthesis bifunctional protein MnmC [Desulfuromonas sp. DDH964]|uniref:phytoene desaturase family protein n=1 Tax=Desulfuromonas sp. DDH964 TaxID=1823759 RepID=UPI00078D5518|nr:FAD-dependent oxidoreductase [Desulfuromonas sp. DDH964]AMV72116.1 tRNA 5-methylaminomethyl-2-thiouridine biosynthesis bifunctional protein MnmC [Desulfuromonas sp. DDH964]
MTYDFVVIGAGISGLTTALILARHGRSVALVEKAPEIAPLLRGFSRSGAHFETGFHYAGGLDEEGILTRFFRYLEIADEVETTPFSGSCFDRLRYPGGDEFHFPVGYDALNAALCEAFPAAAGEITAYLDLVQSACSTLPYLNLDADFGALGPFGALQGPTLAEVLTRGISPPALRRLLALHTLLHGVPAAEVPFALHASVVGLYYRSAHGIRGGGKQLAEVLARQLAARGISIFCGSRALALQWDAAGALEGVLTDRHDLLRSRNCVSSLHPRSFLDLVGAAALRPAYRKRLLGLAETCSGYLGFFTARRPVPLLAGSNLYLAGKAEGDARSPGMPMEDRLLYLAGGATDDGSGPHALVAICPADVAETSAWADSRHGGRPGAYRQFKAEMMARMQARIEEEVPELQGALTLRAGATPLTLRHYLGHPGGGLYGVGHRVGQYNPQAATRLPGVFLTGQATAAPGLLGGMLSGFLTCGEILGHDRLRMEVKRCAH